MNTLIEVGNNHLGCHETTLFLDVTEDFEADINAVKEAHGWSNTDVAAIQMWSDGYRTSSHITLAGDGMPNEWSGTCIALGDEGGFCHMIHLTEFPKQLNSDSH
jgi:hypothetical protein